MPGTAAGLGINPDDPRQALDGAAKLMASYLKKYGGWQAALAAYNGGPGVVGRALPRETRAYISKILGGTNPSSQVSAPKVGSSAASPTRVGSTTKTDTTGAIVDSLLAQKPLSQRKLGGSSLLAAAQGRIESGAYTTTTPGKSVTTTTRPAVAAQAQAQDPSGVAAKLVSRANAIDAKHLPYKWGGGHGGKVNAYAAAPLDCSGAVSAVLGIDPRVASQFKTWGKPGAGGQVTIYAKDSHVLMEINGHFFGTSATNPGGGAGWIPRAAIGSAYLKGFTARHL
jgi:hypothetical protein